MRYSLMGVLLLFLFLPVITKLTHREWAEPLGGYSVPATDTTLNWGSWSSGSYQAKTEVYARENMGNRSLLVRINQQLQYSLFNSTGLEHMLVGKNGCLFDMKGIDAHFGHDFIGEEELKTRMERIAFVSRELKKRKIELVILLAPEKTGFYRELLPQRYVLESRKTNRQGIREYAKKGFFHLVDFQQYFLQQKGKTPYPLMGKAGIHWTHYGANLATDSLQRYLAKLVDYDTPIMVRTRIAEKAADPFDRDMENSLNLLFPTKDVRFGYPEFTWDTVGKQKIDALVIGDSFYWMMKYAGTDQLFDKGNFMYYMKEAHYPDATPMIPIEQFDLENEVMKRKVVLIVCTEANLTELGWGFFERMERWLKAHPAERKQVDESKIFP